MKNTIIILSWIIVLSSCATVKKSHTQEVKKNNDSVSVVKEVVRNDDKSVHKEEVRDSAVGIAGKHTEIQLSSEDTKPAYTVTGKKVTRYYHKDDNGIHIDVTVDTNGGIYVRANTDSMTLVFNSMTKIIDSVSHTNDSLHNEKQKVVKEYYSVTTDTSVKSDGWWMRLWHNIHLVIMGLVAGYLLCLAMPFIIKVIKHWIA